MQLPNLLWLPQEEACATDLVTQTLHRALVGSVQEALEWGTTQLGFDSFVFGIAANDDEKQPDAKVKLKEAFDAAKVPVKIEVYAGTLHGWCVPDMPLQAGKPIYNEPEAERAYRELTALYKRALA